MVRAAAMFHASTSPGAAKFLQPVAERLAGLAWGAVSDLLHGVGHGVELPLCQLGRGSPPGALLAPVSSLVDEPIEEVPRQPGGRLSRRAAGGLHAVPSARYRCAWVTRCRSLAAATSPAAENALKAVTTS